MVQDAKEVRRARIEEAAYTVLLEKGYAGASMLSIAKRAKCSNETLYNWYGDKRGLFAALVARNAAEARQLLEAALAEEGGIREILARFGPVLLTLLLGERAVALNRAAAADATGELGAALAASGRETVRPLLVAVLSRALARGELRCDDAEELADVYLGLLVGDLQIRRVIGSLPTPDSAVIARRVRLAEAGLRALA